MNPIRIAVGILLAVLIAGPAWSQEQSAPPATQADQPASAASHPMRIRVGASVAASQLVHVVQLADHRDKNAMNAIVKGTIVLHAVIDYDGTVMKLEYVSGPPMLTETAMEAVKQWRYRPVMLNGQPVQVDTTINVVFDTDKKGNWKPQPKNP